MEIESLRSQFSVYLVTDQSETLELEAGLEDSGYRFQTFPSLKKVLESSASDPPHVLVFDHTDKVEKLMKGVKSFAEKSPETLIITIVDDIDIALAVSPQIYDFILRPYLQELTLLKSADRACELLYYLYKSEQLQEALEESSEDSQMGPYEASQISELSSVNMLERTSIASIYSQLIRELMVAKNPKESLKCFFKAYYGKVEDSPILFFKYVPQPPAFVVTQSIGIEESSVKGVGVSLKEKISDLSEMVKDPSLSTELDRLILKAFKVERTEKVAFNVEEKVSGVIVVLGEFQRVESRDLFFSLLQVFNVYLSYQQMAFQFHSLQVFVPETGLFSREYFSKCLTEEMSRARRTRSPVTLLSTSLDHFADYKRRAGDELASKLILAMAEILRKTSRLTDVLCDMTSGEFAIILPHTTQKGGAIKAEKIRRIVETAKFPMADILPEKKVTVSIGVGEYPGTAKDKDSLMKAADDALFYVSQRGGNQVCLASTQPGFEPDFEPDDSSAEGAR